MAKISTFCKKIISVVNQKGGVGKTTSAINLAAAFSIYHKKKILVIDFDPQGNASTGLGIPTNDRTHSIYDVLMGDCNINEAIFKTNIPGLFLIPAIVDLSASEIELSNMENREFILKNKISNIINDFDYIIIDCPPSLGLLTVNALTCSDYIMIPMQCEFYSLEGLSHLLTTLELVKQNLNPNLDVLGIILTMHDKRNKLTEQVEADVRKFLGDMVFKNYIPRNVRLSEAPSYGQVALTYDPKCAGSKAYIELSKEVMIKGLEKK
jgi:chromosome partitioning protein